MTIEEMKWMKRERGYTYEQIAQLSGVPLGTVQKIFGGETKYPRYATLQALEKVFRYERVSYEFQEQACGGKHRGFVAEEAVYQVEKRQGEYSVTDCLNMNGERGLELIDGVFYELEQPDPIHQSVVGELYRQLSNGYLDLVTEESIYAAPLSLCLSAAGKTLVQPDVFALPNDCAFTAGWVQGVPSFVAEVLTEASRRKDCFKKMSLYMEAGVREYWIVDYENQRLILYRFEQDPFPQIQELSGKTALQCCHGLVEVDWDLVNRILQKRWGGRSKDEISSYK